MRIAGTAMQHQTPHGMGVIGQPRYRPAAVCKVLTG
jgi:hypothetical protein